MSDTLNFPKKWVKEGSTEILIPVENKISKKLPVFYNPIMKLNRDITIALLKQYPPLHLCDPLAGTGIRSIRFAKELEYKSIIANDINKFAFALTKTNMKHNNVEFEVHNQDANLMLMESKGYDFIDLDVFGSPNFVLDNSVKKIARDGILAVTATDTSALAGTYPKVCQRKYWAVPKKDHMMHETGTRILMRKVQLISTQYEKALTPIYCYSDSHYTRVFFRCKLGKKACDEIIKQHGEFNSAGPMWLGKLWDTELAEKINRHLPSVLTKTIKDESKISTIGFFSINKLCKKHKVGVNKKFDVIIKAIKDKGYRASRTHFDREGIRSNIPEKELEKIIIS